MLFILTGGIQTGKTRWLQKTLADLEAHDIVPYGVIAPGQWLEHRGEDGTVSYEKTGIDNELLPQHTRIPFARRKEDLDASTMSSTCSQAKQAKLSWAIDDRAIERVNEHLSSIEDLAAQLGESPKTRGALLVIDELGPLELLHDKGLTEALSLIEHGSTDAIDNALIVVREQLADTAKQRFGKADWGGIEAIPANDEGAMLLCRACLG